MIATLHKIGHFGGYMMRFANWELLLSTVLLKHFINKPYVQSNTAIEDMMYDFLYQIELWIIFNLSEGGSMDKFQLFG